MSFLRPQISKDQIMKTLKENKIINTYSNTMMSMNESGTKSLITSICDNLLINKNGFRNSFIVNIYQRISNKKLYNKKSIHQLITLQILDNAYIESIFNIIIDNLLKNNNKEITLIFLICCEQMNMDNPLIYELINKQFKIKLNKLQKLEFYIYQIFKSLNNSNNGGILNKKFIYNKTEEYVLLLINQHLRERPEFLEDRTMEELNIKNISSISPIVDRSTSNKTFRSSPILNHLSNDKKINDTDISMLKMDFSKLSDTDKGRFIQKQTMLNGYELLLKYNK